MGAQKMLIYNGVRHIRSHVRGAKYGRKHEMSRYGKRMTENRRVRVILMALYQLIHELFNGLTDTALLLVIAGSDGNNFY